MTPEEVEEFEGYKAKAEKGDRVAQGFLGSCYFEGYGVAKDQVEAVKWLRKAADQGEATAQGFLGFCYFEGYGVAKDEVEAVKWYRKAADQGYPYAQFKLGACYAVGKGVAKNQVEAYAYLSFAGIEYEPARKHLAILKGEMSQEDMSLGKLRMMRLYMLQKEIEAKRAAKRAGK
jgi:TPR repeat protein